MATDETRRQLAYTHISFDDLSRFFLDRKVVAACELCGSNDWSTHDNTDGSVPSLIYTSKYFGDESTRNVSTIYMMSCLNCANMRLFNREIISRWIKNNPRTMPDE